MFGHDISVVGLNGLPVGASGSAVAPREPRPTGVCPGLATAADAAPAAATFTGSTFPLCPTMNSRSGGLVPDSAKAVRPLGAIATTAPKTAPRWRFLKPDPSLITWVSGYLSDGLTRR